MQAQGLAEALKKEHYTAVFTIYWHEVNACASASRSEIPTLQVCANYAMMLPLIAVDVSVLSDLHRPAAGIWLMLTCRAMLFWILL
jgi:hypothetical protein